MTNPKSDSYIFESEKSKFGLTRTSVKIGA